MFVNLSRETGSRVRLVVRLPPITTPTLQAEKGLELRTKMIRIMKATPPTISKAELADLCNITHDGVRYHLRIIKKDTGVHWEGSSINGH